MLIQEAEEGSQLELFQLAAKLNSSIVDDELLLLFTQNPELREKFPQEFRRALRNSYSVPQGLLEDTNHFEAEPELWKDLLANWAVRRKSWRELQSNLNGGAEMEYAEEGIHLLVHSEFVHRSFQQQTRYLPKNSKRWAYLEQNFPGVAKRFNQIRRVAPKGASAFINPVRKVREWAAERLALKCADELVELLNKSKL